jgi:hypothetical protein
MMLMDIYCCSLSVEPSILLSPSPSSTLPAVLLQDVQEEKESAVQERATVLGSRLQSPPGGLLNSSLAQGYPRISLERFSSQGNLFATAARQNSQSGSLGNFLPSGANSTAEVAKSRTSTVRLAKASSSVDIGNSSVGLAAQSPAIGALNRERSRSRSVNDSARPAHQ